MPRTPVARASRGSTSGVERGEEHGEDRASSAEPGPGGSPLPGSSSPMAWLKSWSFRPLRSALLHHDQPGQAPRAGRTTSAATTWRSTATTAPQGAIPRCAPSSADATRRPARVGVRPQPGDAQVQVAVGHVVVQVEGLAAQRARGEGWKAGMPSSSTRPLGISSRSPQQSGVRQRIRPSTLAKSLLLSRVPATTPPSRVRYLMKALAGLPRGSPPWRACRNGRITRPFGLSAGSRRDDGAHVPGPPRRRRASRSPRSRWTSSPPCGRTATGP